MAFLPSSGRTYQIFPWILLFFFPLFLNAQSPEEKIEQQRRLITEESGSELLKMNIYDSGISLLMKGFWKGKAEFNWGLSSGPLGLAPDSGNSPFLFTQEADLTLSLWMRRRWFVELSFLDDYNINTYRAGYQGLPGETVQYLGAGNTGLDFPAFPYLDLGGDSPSSFGAYGRFGLGGLTLHSLLRYDAAAREERIFVGGRERTFSNLSPEKPLRGLSFVLPGTDLSSITVYLEDKNGDIGAGGRRWRIAKPSEYAASAVNGLVELVREPAGMAAVSYSKAGDTQPWNAAMGSYGGLVPGFLREVQLVFDSAPAAARTIKLEEYPQPGASSGIPGTVFINGLPALVIYEPGTFSPFERQSSYRAPSANSQDAALVRLSTGGRISGYQMIPADSILSLELPLYTINGDASRRGVFELLPDGIAGTESRRTFEGLWPLADEYPEIYLPGKQAFSGDISLRWTNYGPQGAYTIGTDVVPGSVQVYRGGIEDPQISYDTGTGMVRLGSPAGANEVIRVTYLKQSEERRLGSLAAGLGLVYKGEDSPFSAQAALGFRWNVAGEAWTEEGAASPGTAGFGGKLSWDYERLKASVSLGLGFEQPDTTGLHRIAGMEGNSEIVLSLSPARAFISEAPPVHSVSVPQEFSDLFPQNRADLVYRNYRNSDVFGVSKLMPIDWAAPVVSGKQGPYPAEDAGMEIFAAEFDLESAGGKNWTGFEVPLGEDGKMLERAKAIVVPLRFYGFLPGAALKIAVQFGALSDSEQGTFENQNLIVEKILFPFAGGAAPGGGWINNQDVTFTLDDAARRKLQGATHMRIIIINNDPSNGLQGRLLAAKPYIMGAAWRAVQISGGELKGAEDSEVSLTETRDGSLQAAFGKEIERLHPSVVNHVLKVEWTAAAAAGAGADGRTGEIPLSQYRVLSFFLKTPEISPAPAGSPGYPRFRFIIGRGPSSIERPEEIALSAEIPGADLYPGGRWVKIELRYGAGERKVFINGRQAAAAVLGYRPGAIRREAAAESMESSGSAYIAAFVDSPSNAGGFSIDEICLEEPAPTYRLNAGSALSYSRPETILSIGDVPLVSDFSVNTALESGVSGDPWTAETESQAALQNRSSLAFSILDTKLDGNVNFHVSSGGNDYWAGGHGISRSFGPLSLGERFNSSPQDNIFDHRLWLEFESPLRARLSSDINYEIQKLRRAWDFFLGSSAVQNGRPGFSLSGGLAYTERTSRGENQNYAEIWTRSFPEMIPDGGIVSASPIEGIQNRDMRGGAGFNLSRSPLGLDLSFEGNSSASIPSRLTQSSSRGVLQVPFIFGSVRGSLRSERNFRRGFRAAGRGAADDLEYYENSLYAAGPLWLSIPIYSIFDPELAALLEKTGPDFFAPEQTENLRWNESFFLNINFPERFDPLSLIIPLSFSSGIDRTIERRLDTTLDVFTVSSVLGFSAINLFGAMGTSPLFPFYRNDEFRHSVSGLVSFPKNEDPVWRIQAEGDLNFFGGKGAELGINNILTAGSLGWVNSTTLLWTVPSGRTLLSIVYGFIMDKLKNREKFPGISSLAGSSYERLRRESLELVVDRSRDSGGFSCAIGHESLIIILGKLNLSAFAKISVRKDDYSGVLSMMLNFGTSLSLTF